MLLQIWVLPITQPAGAEQTSSATQAAIAPAGSRTFLESCPGEITLEQLCTRICVRHDRIYPDKGPLNIKKLQDFYNLDLDLGYVIADVFKDRDSGTPLSSIVKVTQTASTRESSVPLESALRPHRLRIQGRKRQRAGSIGEAENSSSIFIKREADVTDGDRLRERRTVKRRRLQEITRSPSPTFADPDRPLPSRETEEEEAPSSLTHRNGHRERCGSPGHVTERAQYEHVGSSQSMHGTSSRARDATPRRRVHKQPGPLLSPSIIPDSPVLGVPRQQYIPIWHANDTQKEAEAYARPESPPSMDELPMPEPSAVNNAARGPRSNPNTLDQTGRFKSLPPSLLAPTSKSDLHQSSRHSSIGPRALMNSHTPEEALAKSGRAISAQTVASGKNMSAKQGHQSIEPHLVSKHVESIKSDHSHIVNISSDNNKAENGSTMNGSTQIKDIYEFDDSDHTNVVQRPGDKRKHGVTHDKELQAQKQPAQENSKPGKLQLARRSTLPEVWINAVKGGNTDNGAADHKPPKNDSANGNPQEISVFVDNFTGKNAGDARTKKEPIQAREVAPKRVKEGQAKLRASQERQMEQAEETKKEAQGRKTQEISSQAGDDSLQNFERGAGTTEDSKQSEPKIVDARPKSEIDNCEVEIVEYQTEQSEERESKKRRTREPAPNIREFDASDIQNKDKADDEQEERDALEAAKLQLKEKNDRISKEWEERKAAKPTQDQIVAATNSLATRGVQDKKRISSTPFIPNGIRSKDTRLGIGVGLANKELDKPVGLDALVTVPRTVKRTVSFIDEAIASNEKRGQPRDPDRNVPHSQMKGAGGSSISVTKNKSDVPRRSTSPSKVEKAHAKTDDQPVVVKEVIRKQTPVYPPGMGPEDLRPTSVTTEVATVPATETHNENPKSSQKAPTKRATQTTLKFIQGSKGKGKAVQILAPGPIREPKEEIVISDDDDDAAISISSYYSSGSNKSPNSYKGKEDTSQSGNQKSQPVNAEDRAVSKHADQASPVSSRTHTEKYQPETVSSPKEVDAQEKSASKVLASSSLAFQTQLGVVAAPKNIGIEKKPGSKSPSKAFAASGSPPPPKNLTARDKGSKSPSASSSTSSSSIPAKGVTKHGKSRSASPSTSDSASSSSSSGRSLTRSPARYLSRTPQSESVREEGAASKSQSGSTSPTEEESISPSYRDSKSPEGASPNVMRQDLAAIEKHDSASSAEEVDEDNSIDSSPSLPENDQYLNAHLQRDARQSSQSTYPVSSQRTDQKTKLAGNDKEVSSHQSSNTLPRLVGSRKDTTTKRARTVSRVEPYNKTLSRQLSSQLQRTITRHQLPTLSSSRNPTSRISKPALNSKQHESDSEDDEDDESESESLSSGLSEKETNGSDSDNAQDDANLTPPSAQPPRRHPYKQQNQTPKPHRQSSSSTKSATRTRGTILTTPALSSGRGPRGSTGITNAAGAGNRIATKPASAGKVVASRLSGLINTIFPFSSSMG